MNRSDKTYRQNDRELMAAFREGGDLEPLGQLFEKYMHLVYGVCLKYLKDREESRDAAMQVFELLIEKAGKQEIVNFRAWLYVLTKNHCLMKLRSQKSEDEKHKKLMEEGQLFMESAYATHHNDEPDMEKDLALLRKCIKELKKEQQECVKLFYLEEKPYREIAAQLGLGLNKVKSHIQNGKRNLKNCMENHG